MIVKNKISPYKLSKLVSPSKAPSSIRVMSLKDKFRRLRLVKFLNIETLISDILFLLRSLSSCSNRYY